MQQLHSISTCNYRNEQIIIVDDNRRFLSTCNRILTIGGFQNVLCFGSANDVLSEFKELKPDLMLLDIHLEEGLDGLELLYTLRNQGYVGPAVVISGDSSMEQCFRAAKAGANDFILKRPHINVAKEIDRILKESRYGKNEVCVRSLVDLGYLRSFGLTTREIDILQEYTIDYCSQQELARRVGKAPSQLRKVFSRIYRKLGIDSLSQLIHILTSCSMFNNRLR